MIFFFQYLIHVVVVMTRDITRFTVCSLIGAQDRRQTIGRHRASVQTSWEPEEGSRRVGKTGQRDGVIIFHFFVLSLFSDGEQHIDIIQIRHG